MVRTVALQPFLLPNLRCDGRRYRVLSSETVASGTFAVRRRRVSPTATGRWQLSFFFKARSEALAIQGVNGPGRLPSAMMRTVAWRDRMTSSRCPGKRFLLMCGVQRPDGPAAAAKGRGGGVLDHGEGGGLRRGRLGQSGDVCWLRPLLEVAGDCFASRGQPFRSMVPAVRPVNLSRLWRVDLLLSPGS